MSLENLWLATEADLLGRSDSPNAQVAYMRAVLREAFYAGAHAFLEHSRPLIEDKGSVQEFISACKEIKQYYDGQRAERGTLWEASAHPKVVRLVPRAG